MANQTWTAAKGDSLSNTLQSWSKQANVKANIDLDKDVTLPKDFIILAPFDIAVNQLIDQTSALTDFKASRVGGDGFTQGVNAMGNARGCRLYMGCGSNVFD